MSDHESPWVQAVARARRSIVRVHGSGGWGTGFFALSNGVIVTSQELVHYDPVATVVTDEGKQLAAKVVGADVGKDLAFLLPAEPIPAQPMHPAPIAPRVGDSVAVLAQSGHGAAVTPAHIRTTGVELEGLSHIQVDVPLADYDRGAPLIDTGGRVIAVATRPRRVGRADAGPTWQEAFLPRDAFDAELGTVGAPAAQLASATPTYACPSCGVVFSTNVDRCLGCGVMLPHLRTLIRGEPSRRGDDESDQGLLEGTRVVRELLASLGVAASGVRRDERTWRLSLTPASGGAPTDIVVCIDSHGSRLVLQTPVVKLPSAGFEAFYRLLLTLNDETIGLYRLSLSEDVVFLSIAEPTHAVLQQSAKGLTNDLLSVAAHYRGLLSGAYGATPVEAI